MFLTLVRTSECEAKVGKKVMQASSQVYHCAPPTTGTMREKGTGGTKTGKEQIVFPPEATMVAGRKTKKNGDGEMKAGLAAS